MGRQFSHSKLKTFRQCPQQYKFQYIDKPDVTEAVSADIWLGTTVHEMLRLLYEKGSEGVVVPLDTVLERYRTKWEGEAARFVEVRGEFLAVDDYIRNGEKMLSDHYAAYHPFNAGRHLGAEMNINFPLPNSDYTMTARIDRFWKRDDGVVEISDYKTGKRLPSQQDPDFVSQMGIYQLAVMSRHPQFENIEVAQYMLRHNEVVRSRITTDELDLLQHAILNDIADIRASERLDTFQPSEGGYCNYCQYASLCPAKRHRQMMEAVTDDTQSLASGAAELADKFIETAHKAKELEAEKEVLRLRIADTAKELNLTKLEGRLGTVNIKDHNAEAFVTKTQSSEEFAELCRLARELGYDDYFVLDYRSFLKEVYSRNSMSQEHKAQFEKFIRIVRDLKVTHRLKQSSDGSD